MKNIQHKLIALLFIALALPYPASSQGSSAFEPEYEVNRIYPYISITEEKLNSVQTLIDINEHYKSSWIREYISVEISASYEGRTKKAISKNETLSQEQKDLINMADLGTDIAVKVQYMPENALKNNDIKEMPFTFTIDPKSDAKYPGGQQQLKQYLKDNAMAKIPDSNFKRYNLTALKFTINEEGQIIDAHVFETSKDKKIDDLLLEAISNMPSWKPAEYANGTKAKQDFVLTVGDHESCVINLLNIRKDNH